MPKKGSHPGPLALGGPHLLVVLLQAAPHLAVPLQVVLQPAVLLLGVLRRERTASRVRWGRLHQAARDKVHLAVLEAVLLGVLQAAVGTAKRASHCSTTATLTAEAA